MHPFILSSAAAEKGGHDRLMSEAADWTRQGVNTYRIKEGIMFFEYIIAILILAVYAWLIYFAIKGGNMTFGFFFTGLLWTIICLVAWHTGFLSPEFTAANAEYVNTPVMDQINTIFQDGIRNQGLQTVDIITGAWFGEVLMMTGISQTLIRKCVEFGGDRPLTVMIILDIVVALLFTSIFGIGAVIAIGIIVLPILFSLGVPKVIACLSYLFSVAAGNFLNPVLNEAYYATFSTNAEGIQEYAYANWAPTYGYIACIVAVVFVIIMTVILMKGTGRSRAKAWAAPNPATADNGPKEVPAIALLLPFMPTVTILCFRTANIPTFLVWGWIALIVCGCAKGMTGAANSFVKTLVNAVNNSAGLIVFLLMLACITQPINLAKPFIALLVEPIIPANAPVILALAFAVLAPLALFRGPLTIYGTAGPIFVILAGMGYSYTFLFPLFMAPSICMNMAACPTQSYVAWAINYAKIQTKDYLRKSVWWGWAFTAVMEILVIFLVAR